MVGAFLSTGGLASDVEASEVGGRTGASVSASIPLLVALGVLCETGGAATGGGGGRG